MNKRKDFNNTNKIIGEENLYYDISNINEQEKYLICALGDIRYRLNKMFKGFDSSQLYKLDVSWDTTSGIKEWSNAHDEEILTLMNILINVRENKRFQDCESEYYLRMCQAQKDSQF